MTTVIESTKQPLVLVRHGESTWNALHLVQGQDDRATLTPRGRQQAADVAHTLRSYDFDLIVSSDLQRAMATALIIARALELKVETDPALRERGFGVAEGGPSEALTAALLGIEDGVVVNDRVSPEGGETLRDFRARVGAFVDERHRRWPDQRLLLVTHGGTIRAMQGYCGGTPLQGSRWDRVGNCTVWTVAATRD
jgi:2,3-bisphosphoglycerate-dependent phosphoglycerate mutase